MAAIGESKSMLEREIESMRIDLSNDEKVKSFVAKFPEQEQPLDCRALDVAASRRTFWNKTTTASKPQRKSARRRISSSSSCCSDVDGLIADPDVWTSWRIHEKIKLAFSMVYSHRLPGLIQFWAPVNVGETKSSTTLSTSCQPFALDDLANPTLFDYRLFSTSYHPLLSDQSVVDDPLATAFLTRFPQVVLDLRKIAHKGSPLVNKAVDCGLTCLILLPVFHHPLRRRSYCTYSCVGVVECCINVPPLVPPLLRSLDLELKRVCLSTYHVQQRLTYEPSHGLCLAKDEIDKALKIVCESLRLNLAQVWIVDDSVSHVSTPSSSSSSPSLSPSPSPSSSLSLSSSSSTTSSEDTHLQTKQPGKYLVKLCGYIGVCIAPVADHDATLNYCHTCDVLPLKSEDPGLVGRTLASGKALFCSDANKLGGFRGLHGVSFRRTKCSSVTLCLRSAHTGIDVSYGFEFLWPKDIDHTVLLESLLLMLKMCLPSFMFASGAQLGDELGVLDLVKTKATGKVSSFTVLPGNWFSQTPNASKKEDWQTPKLEKRKLSDLYDEESQTDSDDPGYDSDCSLVRFVDRQLTANCRGTLIFIRFDIPYTLADVKQKVEKEFNLDPRAYTMEYQLFGERFVIDTNGDLTSCIGRWKTYLRKSIDKPFFGVDVLPYAEQPHAIDK